MIHFLLAAAAIYFLLICKNVVLFLMFSSACVIAALLHSPGRPAILGGAGKPWVDSLSLIDPKFNMREVMKQLILLEDHLFHENKHCRDCITKHFMTIEAYLDEAQTMKTDDTETQKDVASMLPDIKNLSHKCLSAYKEKRSPAYVEIGNKLRLLRKKYQQKYAVY